MIPHDGVAIIGQQQHCNNVSPHLRGHASDKKDARQKSVVPSIIVVGAETVELGHRAVGRGCCQIVYLALTSHLGGGGHDC